MSKHTSSTSRYRDDPEEGDAVSLHTTPDDYDYDDAPELPSYSDSEAAASASRQGNEPARQAVISDPYGRVQPLSSAVVWSGNKLKNVNETTVRMNSMLADPDELEKYIRDYLASAPPDQHIRMMGTHTEKQYNSSSKKNESQKVVDFDISISLSSYLTRERGLWQTFVPQSDESAYRGSFRKTKAKGPRQDVESAESAESAEQTLQDWCREYCNDKSTVKAFRVTRQVSGLDEAFLRHSLEHTVRSTHYHGHLDISFPIIEKHVDIYNDHWINRWRFGWQRYLFYLTFLFLITWPVLFFATRYWSVYTVRWLWSRCHTDHEQERAYMVYASLSEKQWLERHKNLLKSLVLEKYQGDATQFPTDVPDERVTRGIQARLPRTPSTGNNNVDAAVSFIQGGVSAWNTLQGRGGGGDPNAWGADS